MSKKCTFRTNLIYLGKNGLPVTQKDAAIQKEVFADCYGAECMAYNIAFNMCTKREKKGKE